MQWSEGFRVYADILERVLANSFPAEDSAYRGSRCWLWLGKVAWSNTANGRQSKPYPVISLRYKAGPRKGKQYNARAHRKVVEWFKNLRVTPKMVVMHLCNNTLCVNPEHLSGGTQKKNVRQCVAERRHKTPFRHAEMRMAL